jgi:hypothetical protein
MMRKTLVAAATVTTVVGLVLFLKPSRSPEVKSSKAGVRRHGVMNPSCVTPSGSALRSRTRVNGAGSESDPCLARLS